MQRIKEYARIFYSDVATTNALRQPTTKISIRIDTNDVRKT